ncbi:MAG: hypothetical protein GX793_04400, partial [Bacteroidales bacterium]|nr:hypothetical protein [Bacteroidales bacterium]
PRFSLVPNKIITFSTDAKSLVLHKIARFSPLVCMGRLVLVSITVTGDTRMSIICTLDDCAAINPLIVRDIANKISFAFMTPLF